MENHEKTMADILAKIKELPAGNITRKTIRGKLRMYLQWREEGKTKSKYIKAAEEEEVESAVALRKELEAEYQRLKIVAHESPAEKIKNRYEFCTNVKMGEELVSACKNVTRYKERECIQILKSYLTRALALEKLSHWSLIIRWEAGWSCKWMAQPVNSNLKLKNQHFAQL